MARLHEGHRHGYRKKKAWYGTNRGHMVPEELVSQTLGQREELGQCRNYLFCDFPIFHIRAVPHLSLRAKLRGIYRMGLAAAVFHQSEHAFPSANATGDVPTFAAYHL